MKPQRANQARMDAIYTDCFDAIAAYCMRRLPVSSANDAIAEVFLVAWRKLDSVPTGESTLPYLYGVAGNVIAHSRRSYARQGRLKTKLATIAPIVAPDPETQVLDQVDHLEVHNALGTLSAPDQEVIRLRAWEELTAPQIAAALNISVSAAEKRIARSFARLEQALDGTGRSTIKGSRT